ncbi:hypothetical protein ZIOFF_001671 [Zingiber officinale]|uniref:Uncharacterized protein n=1 Tax=Zingiber officinale TaxID=94328 RepID=A0A8J5LV76_ZINOF|nr:hypothetical protein ZIOFF_001671 [Zingiber officinale]
MFNFFDELLATKRGEKKAPPALGQRRKRRGSGSIAREETGEGFDEGRKGNRRGSTKSLVPSSAKPHRAFIIRSTAAEKSTFDYSSTVSVFPMEACDILGGEACDTKMFPEVKLAASDKNTAGSSVASEEIERDYLEYDDSKTHVMTLEESSAKLSTKVVFTKREMNLADEYSETHAACGRSCV